MTEKVLAYDRSIVGQETGYWCGPASAQVVLNGMGVVKPELDLAREIGTTTRGTDFVGLIERVLDRHAANANYTSVYTERDPMSTAQKDALWGHIVQSINAGYGVVMNWVAPPRNKPRGVKGSQSPRYSGGTTYHYVSCMGYDDVERAVWIADSGFQPQGYWISFDQCATLIPPKGYCYANTKSTADTPPPAPAQTPPVALLSKAMGDAVGLDIYAALLPWVSDALRKSGCTTNARIAMWCAQIGHESVGLKFMRELWGPTKDQLSYQGRMGNTNPGDGERYKGRGPIQVTGKNNYRELSEWAASRGYVPSATFFVEFPEKLEEYRYAFLGAVWYWTEAQPRLNGYADAGNIEDASKAINAPAWIGTPKRANGMDGEGGRVSRYKRCQTMDLTPLLAGVGKDEDEMAGWTPELVNRAMVLMENTAGVLRPSLSPLRWPGETFSDTSVGYARRADALGHFMYAEKLAVDYKDVETVALLMSVEACAENPGKFPDRQADAKIAKQILAKVEKSVKADGYDFVQQWLEAEKANS